MAKTTVLGVIFSLYFQYCWCSIGNESPFFGKCVVKCLDKNCLQEGAAFRFSFPRPFYLELLKWTCADECDYECMWQTVEGFVARKYRVPQFYGKWPFVRFFGIQEPASTIFSLLNLYAHVRMMKRLKNELRPDTPLRWLWFLYGVVSCHAWIWSAIFHARDLEFTEFMDYSCAFTIVLMSCYSMLIRVLRNYPKVNLVSTILFITFLIDHVLYLRRGRFDYGYNMRVNIFIGCASVVCWTAWVMWNRHKIPHAWKIQLYVTLVVVTTLLEVIDIPPILWAFDCHAIWHLSTVPLHFIFYSFIIDDCKYLRNEEMKYEKLPDSK